MACLTETVIYQAIQGDRAAFAKVYQHYRTPALKFSLSLLKDKEEAENMVHDVFIKIWEKRALINPELNFSSYLFTCLRNMIFDYLKQLEKSQLLRQRYMERMERTTEDDQDELETRYIALHKAINALSEKRKLILLLNVEGGKSYQEIAESLRISKNTVKNQLVKAKQLLRDRVDIAN
ncbi:RNA polymerase sigma factor [Spirosoma litoris]